MRRYLRPLFILLLCAAAGRGGAQDIPVCHYTVDNGLPSNMVYSVYRSSNGYLWFATDKGIARCNGMKFEKYSTFNGLPDNEIFGFQEDSKGRLWLETYNGELCYFQDGIFHTIENTPFLRVPVKGSFIKDIVPEDDSSVTISFGDNSRFINVKDQHCTVYNLERIKGYSALQIITKKKLRQGHFRLILPDQTFEIDSVGNIVHVALIDYSKYKGQKVVNWARSLVQNQHVVYNEFCIYRSDMQPLRPLSKSVFKDDIRQIYFNKEGFFFCTKKGLLLNDSLLILAGNTTCITQDESGNYWLSTVDNGVYLFGQDFRKTAYHAGAYKGPVNYVRGGGREILFVAEDKNVYQLKNKIVTQVLDYDQYKLPGLKVAKASAYLIDSNYRFFFSNTNGVAIVDNLFSKHKKIDRFEIVSPGYYTFSKIVKDNTTLYFNARLAIMSLEYQKKYEPDQALNKVSDSARRFFTMAQAVDGSVWCSTINSVYKVVDGKARVQPQFGPLSFKSFDFYGSYLVGYTHHNQLVVCSDIEGNMTVDSVTMQNCIWDKMCKVDSVHVLISTNNLYRLLTLRKDKVAGRFPMLAIENRFVPNDVENMCADSLNLYFFKNGNITVLDKESLFRAANPPTVNFTLIKSGRWYHPVLNYIKVPYGESKNIKILFNAISYGGKELIYQYSVSRGPKDSWVDVSGDEINLSNPTYGNYTVKLRARSISSRYSEPVVFRMTVLRPYWATKWFIALAVCGVIACIWLISRLVFLYVIRKKELRHKKEMKFLKSEYKALNALMNPHFIFNTLNNVQSLVNDNNKQAANEYLRVFADLIRQNMYNVSKEMISLQREMDLVRNYLLLEQLRFEDQLDYQVDIDDNVDTSEIMIPPLLIQPLVENSIKHGILPSGRGGMIHIHIYQRNGKLYIEVRDNGIGIQVPAHVGTGTHESFGLRNIEKRIQQLGVIQNKKIEMNIRETDDVAEDMDMHWTVVTISLPLD